MLNYIFFNLKSNLRRKENCILILLFIFCEVVLLFILNSRVSTESPYQESFGISSSNVSQKQDSDLYKEFMDEINLINQEIEIGELAGKNRDWQTYCKYKVKTSVLEAQWFAFTSNVNTESYFEHWDTIQSLRKEYEITDLSKYKKLIAQKSNDYIDLYYTSQQSARYFDYLLKHNLTPITYSYVDSATILLQLARYVFPILLPLMVGLLMFQQNEWRAKTSKTILTISGMKKKYVRWNLISDILFILLIVFVPVCIFFIGLAFFNGLSNLNYPILYYHTGLTGLNYWDTRGLDHIEPIACGLTNMSVNQFTTPGMEIMPLWQCLLWIAIGIVLLSTFYVLLISLLSTIIKNKYLSLIWFLVTLGLCTFISPIGNMQKINTLNPMSYRDFGVNILGTSYFGYLYGVLVIGIYSTILYLVLKWCAKKVHA